MIRLFSILALASALLSAGLLYFVKYDTRALDARNTALRQQIETLKGDVSVLRAEIGTLTQPQRMERLARERLGLRPMRPDQVKQMAVTRGDTDKDGSR